MPISSLLSVRSLPYATLETETHKLLCEFVTSNSIGVHHLPSHRTDRSADAETFFFTDFVFTGLNE